VIIRIAALLAALGAAQLLPPAGDGDIRVAYYELQNRSDVWLTLEPRAQNGNRAPHVTFTHSFPGKRQTTAPREVLVQAFAGHFWAPRAELWFDLDGKERIDVSPGVNIVGPLQGAADDYWGGPVSIDVIYRMALVHDVRGSALGFPFELSASQRQALRAWLDRIDPGGLPPFLRPHE
jgi:hypothetical protein